MMYTASYVDSLLPAYKREHSKAEAVRWLAMMCQDWPYVFGAAGEKCTPAAASTPER